MEQPRGRAYRQDTFDLLLAGDAFNSKVFDAEVTFPRLAADPVHYESH